MLRRAGGTPVPGPPSQQTQLCTGLFYSRKKKEKGKEVVGRRVIRKEGGREGEVKGRKEKKGRKQKFTREGKGKKKIKSVHSEFGLVTLLSITNSGCLYCRVYLNEGRWQTEKSRVYVEQVHGFHSVLEEPQN